MNTQKSTKGFTLIELLIVIAIIGILAVAFLPTLLGAPAKGRDTARIADLQKLQKVLVNFNLEGGSYPASACVNAASVFGTDAKLLGGLGGKIPKDPGNPGYDLPSIDLKDCAAGEYVYIKDPDSSGKYSFGLYAHMDTKEAGNTKCDGIDADTDTLTTVDTAANSCYMILTQ